MNQHFKNRIKTYQSKKKKKKLLIYIRVRVITHNMEHGSLMGFRNLADTIILFGGSGLTCNTSSVGE